MKKLIIALVVLAIMATPCFGQVRQFQTYRQGNLTTVYDSTTGQTYYFYDQTPAQPQQQITPAPPKNSDSFCDFLKIPQKDRWIYE